MTLLLHPHAKMMLFSKVIILFDCDTTLLFKLCLCPAKRVLLKFSFSNSLFTSWSNWIFSFCKPILSFFLCFLLSVTLLNFERCNANSTKSDTLLLPICDFTALFFLLNFRYFFFLLSLNLIFRVIPHQNHFPSFHTLPLSHPIIGLLTSAQHRKKYSTILLGNLLRWFQSEQVSLIANQMG